MATPGSSFLPSVVQAGGTVSINATNKISNGVERSFTNGTPGVTRTIDTTATGTGVSNIILLNKQLPPNLAQQQVNPLTLPGFSLPSGTNGLFRLSDQAAKDSPISQGTSAPESWALSGATVDLAQREKNLPATQGRTLQLDDIAHLTANTGQLSVTARVASGIGANGSAINASGIGTIDNGTWQPGRSKGGDITRSDGIGSQGSGGSSGDSFSASGPNVNLDGLTPTDRDTRITLTTPGGQSGANGPQLNVPGLSTGDRNTKVTGSQQGGDRPDLQLPGLTTGARDTQIAVTTPGASTGNQPGLNVPGLASGTRDTTVSSNPQSGTRPDLQLPGLTPSDRDTQIAITAPGAASSGGDSLPALTPQAQQVTITAPSPSTVATVAPAARDTQAVQTPTDHPATPTVDSRTTATAQPSTAQTIERVQGLPDRSAVSQPHKYLIETNPVLTDLKSFMSSDYLLSGLGYNPDDSAKRLGDGFYEQRLIQQAIVAGTGQRFIAGLNSDEAMFKYLMDNAIASKQQLNLSLGVTLTAQQVAALTHDIVWLEEIEVNGQKVLVPVLYLADAANRLAPNGALIAGNDVNLIAGQDLLNAGTLRANNNLSAMAGNDIVNSGVIEAGNRLDLLAGNNIVNRAGGIISGRDVSLTTVLGDVINERSVTSHIPSGLNQRTDYLDSAARIEAANDMSINAGRDFLSAGGALQSGRDISKQAGRDALLGSAETVSSSVYGRTTTQTITQNGSTVTAGRDFSAVAGRDFAAIASQIDALRDIDLAATGDMTLMSAADETHYAYTSKKLKVQEDHVSQVSTTLKAGGDIALSAGQDLALSASRVTAGDEAYLVAGGRLDLLAAEDSDYSLYDKKKKGSLGSKYTKRDEITQVTNIGSEITTGGDLTLESGSDQHYQAAKLNSGGDLTLDSGGDITFEAVKDLHQESHEKSKSDAGWFSMKGKGSTDETVRQSELVAQGDLVIKAVGTIHADVLQVNQQTVHESIDAMVKADPKLAWLKELEAQGGVDWRQVQEIHTSFKYSNSGLGPAAQIIIAILMSVLVGPAAAGMVAGGGATAAAVGAVAASAATTATVSTINNRGNLGAVLKDVTSPDAIKGYVVAGVTAGVTKGLIDPKFSGTNAAFENTAGFDLGTLEGFTGYSVRAGVIGVTNGAISTAINGGSFGDNLAGALASQASNVVMATSFNAVGTWAEGKYADGSLQKVVAHALVGGLLSEATGGDFKTGALAAGATEAMVEALSNELTMNKDMESLASQIIGVAAAAFTGGDMVKAAELARSSNAYNRQLHNFEAKQIAKEAAKLTAQGQSKSGMLWEDLLLIASGAELDAQGTARLKGILNIYGSNDPGSDWFKHDMEQASAIIGELASQGLMLKWDDGSTVVAHGEPVYAFQATEKQWADSNLFSKDLSSPQTTNYQTSYIGFAPREWKEQFGSAQAEQYLREIAKAAGSGTEDLNTAFERMATVAHGGALPVTWDVDIALNLAGGGKLGVEATRNLAKWVSGRVAGSGAKATGGAVDRATTGIEWGKGIQGQGMPWEDYLGTQLPAGSRLPPNFKTFDFFDETAGIATSAKTLDTTTAAKLANPSQVYSSLKGNIDAAANFVESGLKGVTVTSSQITARELQVAIPEATTGAQWEQINRAIEYGQSKGVTVKITKVN